MRGLSLQHQEYQSDSLVAALSLAGPQHLEDLNVSAESCLTPAKSNKHLIKAKAARMASYQNHEGLPPRIPRCAVLVAELGRLVNCCE